MTNDFHDVSHLWPHFNTLFSFQCTSVLLPRCFLLLPDPQHRAASENRIDETIAMEKSPLNRLPSELRLEIFEYVFTYESLACKDRYWWALREGERKYRALSKELDVTLVCKQIRKETQHLPFSLNKLVCGNELGDFDPRSEWWDGLPLKTPCTVAYNALKRLTDVLSHHTTLELHLWAYPSMSEVRKMSVSEWAELSNTFEALVSVLGPAKLIVHLHFILHFSDLECGYMDPLIAHDEAVFEIHAGRSTVTKEGMSLLVATINNKREEIKHHEKHQEDGHCPINSCNNVLSRQLMEAEQVCRRFMSLAIHASTSGHTSIDMSEIKECLPSGQHELRRDSAHPRREDEHP
jgi:hypothetical protein